MDAALNLKLLLLLVVDCVINPDYDGQAGEVFGLEKGGSYPFIAPHAAQNLVGMKCAEFVDPEKIADRQAEVVADINNANEALEADVELKSPATNTKKSAASKNKTTPPNPEFDKKVTELMKLTRTDLVNVADENRLKFDITDTKSALAAIIAQSELDSEK